MSEVFVYKINESEASAIFVYKLSLVRNLTCKSTLGSQYLTFFYNHVLSIPMERSPLLDRLPIIATALLFAGKMQSGAPVDTKPQEDIRMDTQGAVYEVLDAIHVSSFELEFPQPADQFEKADASQTTSSADQPFLPFKRRKGKKPKREDWSSSCPPPPFLLLSSDDLLGHSSYRDREEPIMTMQII